MKIFLIFSFTKIAFAGPVFSEDPNLLKLNLEKKTESNTLLNSEPTIDFLVLTLSYGHMNTEKIKGVILVNPELLGLKQMPLN